MHNTMEMRTSATNNRASHWAQFTQWARITLALAALYNIAWGLAVVLWPGALFRWCAMEPPNYPELWQCIGMIVGVYGIGYAIAAADPVRHWPIVLVGLLGKLFGPLGFLQAALAGRLPWKFGATLLFNDLLWWIPFAAILVSIARSPRDSRTNPCSRTQIDD